MESHHDDFGDGLDDPVLAGLLTELRALADEPAPAIGPGLAAALGGAVPLATARTHRSRTASALALALVSTGVLAGGISAAAADELPAPVQRVVARVVNTMTPFEIPDRAERIPVEQAPDEKVPAQQGPTGRDEDTPPPDVDPSPSPATSESESTTDPGEEGGDATDPQSGGEDGDRGSNTGDGAEDGNRSIDDRTRDEDHDENQDQDRDERDPDSDAPDEASGGDGSGGGGDDSDDDGVESGDVED